MAQSISTRNWLLLLVLSVLWGGSFIFIGVAVRELAALEIVFARVGIAALVLIPVHWIMQGALPGEARVWMRIAGMSLFNNVIPFSLIVYGQHFVTAGLASVINATTPLFGAVIMALAGVEMLTGRKTAGLVIGLAGVVVLRGVGLADLSQETIGMLAVLLASASYGLSGLWAKKNLAGIPPVTSATCQLIMSSVIMGVLVLLFGDPAVFTAVSANAWNAILALAVVSTALAYLIFFNIIASAGPSVVLLVTMMIPVSAIAMGSVFLGERLSASEIIGALIIGAGLLVIDGRVLKSLGFKA